jgi:hypothetical protein
MPQRVIYAWTIVLGIAGLVLAGGLVLLGMDLYRASQTGPRWKRRLLAATMIILSASGVYAAGRKVADEVKTPAIAIPVNELKKTPLVKTPHWRRLMQTWKEADDVTSGRKGAYPFDAKGKKTLLDALKTLAGDVDALAAAGLLSVPEAGLLKSELLRLTTGVQKKRPTEMRMATCYEPMMLTPARDSLTRLTHRLSLLERLVNDESLHPAAIEKILAAIESDLAILSKPPTPADAWWNDENRKKAADACKSAQTRIAKIKARVSAESREQWKVIIDAWRFTKPLAKTGKSTTAQRKEATEKLKAARQATDELARLGAMSAAEAGLLAAEAGTIQQEIFRDPPTDLQVKCYLMMGFSPVRQSLDRLTKRLPLLKTVAENGKVTPSVVAKILPTIRTDLNMLCNPAELKKLNAADRQKADKLRMEIEELIKQIEKSPVRPKRRRGPTCYMPMPQSRVDENPDGLNKRLAQLNSLAQKGKLAPDVIAKTLRIIHADLAMLEAENSPEDTK